MDTRLIVILTAMNVEYQAVRARLRDVRPYRHPRGTRFEVGRLADGRCEVALGLVGKGNQPAAALTERAISEFKPAALFFVGVAGALRSHLAMGDVVFGTHIYAYHGGTSAPERFKIRPRVWETSHAAVQLAQQIDRESRWQGSPGQGDRLPAVHFGPIAAGEVVLNAKESAVARRLDDSYNDALAVEMEGAGAAQAGQLNESLPVIVVRGISDRADGTKESTDRQQWQDRAATNAAAFATVLAEKLSAELPHEGRPMTPESSTGASAPGTTSNFATGNARVGAQAAVVYGGVHNGPDRPVSGDLAETLAALRKRLRSARDEGRLDEATYAAVEAELANADAALRNGLPQGGGNKVVLALKKLLGLVADAADLTADVAAAISIARSLS